jgi:hypothetical protein
MLVHAFAGQPPSLQDYQGPLKRLWRPGQSESHTAAAADDIQAFTPLGSQGQEGQADTPPLHTSSPQSSLNTSSDAHGLSRSSMTYTTTDTTRSSSTLEGGTAR